MTYRKTADRQSPAFLKAWEDYSAACRTMFERLSDPSSMTAGGAVPLEFLGPWKDFAQNLGMHPDMAAGVTFKPEEIFAGLLPALGISREYQEIGRRMLELTRQFQRRYAEFAQQEADIGHKALQAFQKRTSNDESMQMSPAALYDAWIDSAEEAYAGSAHGEPFARLLADLCNILSAFKIERGKLLETIARQLDWPSRAEVDSLHRRIRALTEPAKRAARPTAPDSPKAGKSTGRAPTVRKPTIRKPTARKPSKRAGK